MALTEEPDHTDPVSLRVASLRALKIRHERARALELQNVKQGADDHELLRQQKEKSSAIYRGAHDALTKSCKDGLHPMTGLTTDFDGFLMHSARAGTKQGMILCNATLLKEKKKKETRRGMSARTVASAAYK